MPHQCTTCGRTFEDGSKEMLSGCPDCGGNKFQFKPARAVDGNAGGANGAGATSAATAPKKTPDSATGETSRTAADETSKATADDSSERGGGAPETGGDDRPSAVNRAAATVRDWVRSGGSAESSEQSRTDSTRNAPAATRTEAPEVEDSAQATARRDVVNESELPANHADEDVSDETSDDETPGLKELREELNSQFESIRIVEPGQYELNLMELYEREEYIIALRQDGKYVIEVPDAWDASE